MTSSPSISPPADSLSEPAADEPAPRPPRRRPISLRWLLRGLLACACVAAIVLGATQPGGVGEDPLAGVDPATAVVLVVAAGDRYGEARFHLVAADQPELTDDAEIRAALAAELASGAIQAVYLAVAPGVAQREVDRARRLVGEAAPAGKTLSLFLVPHSPAPQS